MRETLTSTVQRVSLLSTLSKEAPASIASFVYDAVVGGPLSLHGSRLCTLYAEVSGLPGHAAVIRDGYELFALRWLSSADGSEAAASGLGEVLRNFLDITLDLLAVGDSNTVTLTQ
jgi:hypothetical protein